MYQQFFKSIILKKVIPIFFRKMNRFKIAQEKRDEKKKMKHDLAVSRGLRTAQSKYG